SFYRLQQFIAYKARLVGIRVEWVNPKDTSRRARGAGTVLRRTGAASGSGAGSAAPKPTWPLSAPGPGVLPLAAWPRRRKPPFEGRRPVR
ncbi:zinc ribbon domain-containing protein, partial [Hydrogenibacillus schlegelii]|uniref:zinc ribbon domain-containing protein n=1 Tax=Hydrogenibacillus schlegelii TaxID=1484 RepID=UPI003F6445F1